MLIRAKSEKKYQGDQRSESDFRIEQFLNRGGKKS